LLWWPLEATALAHAVAQPQLAVISPFFFFFFFFFLICVWPPHILSLCRDNNREPFWTTVFFLIGASWWLKPHRVTQ
jgi:hypothetical protein